MSKYEFTVEQWAAFCVCWTFCCKKRANTGFTGCRQGRWGPTLPRLVPGWICKSWEICASPPPPLSPDLLEWISTQTIVYLWKNPYIIYIGHAITFILYKIGTIFKSKVFWVGLVFPPAWLVCTNTQKLSLNIHCILYSQEGAHFLKGLFYYRNCSNCVFFCPFFLFFFRFMCFYGVVQ